MSQFRNWGSLLIIMVVLLVTSSNVEASGARRMEEEMRGVWITRFEWPDREPLVCRQKIVTLLDQAAENGFNAVFFQIRGQADVFYPSPYEPWSPILGSRDPGFDPLQFALEEAHARKLEFHAYMNAFPVWGGRGTPPRTDPEHLYWTHCQPDSPDPWMCFGKDGKPVTGGSEYIYLSPGIPAVQDYVRKVVLDVARRYNVDGIHFDRIRYPGPNVSHDPVSRARFAGSGNPDGLGWEDWQRDQITRMVNNIYGALLELKPHLNVSASVWGIYDKTRIPGYSRFSSGYHDYYQDSRKWIELGAMDALVPMIYWDIPDPKPNYDELLDDFVANAYGRHIYGGYHANYENFSEIENEILYTRRAGGHGTVAFASSYLDRKNYWHRLGNSVFRTPARTPDLHWKTRSKTGAIVGDVIGPEGQPLVDAKINLSGQTYNWLSSGDGFFACLNLPPGEYKLAIEHGAIGRMEYPKVIVKSGKVTRVPLRLRSPVAPAGAK